MIRNNAHRPEGAGPVRTTHTTTEDTVNDNATPEVEPTLPGIRDALLRIEANFKQGVGRITDRIDSRPPEAFLSADDLTEVAHAGRCGDCGEGHGIHVELRGGEIEWTPVQAHTPECPRSALCGADVDGRPCVRNCGHDGPHNYRYADGLPETQHATEENQ